jgi:hypothetical protein
VPEPGASDVVVGRRVLNALAAAAVPGGTAVVGATAVVGGASVAGGTVTAGGRVVDIVGAGPAAWPAAGRRGGLLADTAMTRPAPIAAVVNQDRAIAPR